MDKHHLFQEFRSVLCQQELPDTVQAVAVLSGPPTRDSSGNITSEYSSENIARIAFGMQTILMIAAKKQGKSLEEVSFGDGPPLVLNGDEKQIKPMEEIARDLGFLSEKMILVSCGRREECNTKKQFEKMVSDPLCRDFGQVVYITHDYHALRVALTAKKYLPPDSHCIVFPVPNGYQGCFYDTFRAFRREIGKIQEYAQRGDIAASL